MALLKRLERNETLRPAVKEVQAWMQRHDEALTKRHWFTYVNMEKLDKPEGILSKGIRKPAVLTCCVVAEVAIATFEAVKHFYELLAVVCDRWEFEAFLIKAQDIVNKTVDRIDILAYTAFKITFHYTGDTSLETILRRQTQLIDIQAFSIGKKAILGGDQGTYRFEDVEAINVVTKEEIEEATQRASHIRVDKTLKASSFVRGGCRHIELSTQGFSDLEELRALDALEGEPLIKKRRAITNDHPCTQKLRYLLEVSDKPVHLTVDPLSLWFVLELRETMEGFADKLAVLEIREGEGVSSATSDAILVYLQKKLEEKHSSFHHVFLMQKAEKPQPSEITKNEKLKRKVFYCNTSGSVYADDVRRLEKLMVEAHTHAHLQPAPFLTTTTERTNMGISRLSVARYRQWSLQEEVTSEDIIPWMGERAVPRSIFTWNSKINLSYVTEKGFFGFYFETVDDFANFCQAFTRLKSEGGDFALPCLFFNAPDSKARAKVLIENLNTHAEALGVKNVYFHVDNIDDAVNLDVKALDEMEIYTFKFSKKDSQIETLSELPIKDLQAARLAQQTPGEPLEVSFFDEGLITEKSIDELVSAGDNLTTDEAVELAMTRLNITEEDWRGRLKKLFEDKRARDATGVEALVEALDSLIKTYDQGRKSSSTALLTFEMLMKIFEGNKTFKAQVNALLSEIEGIEERFEDKIRYVLDNPQALETHVSHKISEHQDKIKTQMSAIKKAINDAIALAKLDQQGDDYNAKRWKNNRETKAIVAGLQAAITRAQATAKASHEQINLAQLKPSYDEVSRIQRVHQKLNVLLRHVRRARARDLNEMGAFDGNAQRVYSRFELPVIFAPKTIITKKAVEAINESKPKAIYLFVDGNNLVHNLNQLQHVVVKGLTVYLMPSKDVGSFKVARNLLREYEQIQKAPPAANLVASPILEYAQTSIDRAKTAIEVLKQKGVLVCQWLPRFNRPALEKLGISKPNNLDIHQEEVDEDAMSTGTATDLEDDDGTHSVKSSISSENSEKDLSQTEDSEQPIKTSLANMHDDQIYFRSSLFNSKPIKGNWCYDAYKLLKHLGITRSVFSSLGGPAK
jgi:hypothetical protein